MSLFVSSPSIWQSLSTVLVKRSDLLLIGNSMLCSIKIALDFEQYSFVKKKMNKFWNNTVCYLLILAVLETINHRKYCKSSVFGLNKSNYLFIYLKAKWGMSFNKNIYFLISFFFYIQYWNQHLNKKYYIL